ncbi:MAG: beta-ketoacyl-ACP synthase II [Elusimicrobiota bacterium]
MSSRRVVITGLGAVAPSGIGVNEFWNNTLSGKSFIRKITKFDPSGHTSQISGEIHGFSAKDYVDSRQIKRTDLSTHYAIAAAKMAQDDSKLNLENEDPGKVGIIIGIAAGGIDYTEQQFYNYYRGKGLKGISTFTTIGVYSCAAVGQISIDFGFTGYNNAVTTGCTAGTVALGNSYMAIKQGMADVMFSGGIEAPVTPLTVRAFSAMKALSTRNDAPEAASRPFEKERDGFIIAEGAGILVMEEMEHALKRGAPIYAEVAGYGTTCNAYHMTAPSPDGKENARAMKQAMEQGNLKPQDIDYIHAHGSSTKLNGLAETKAIKRAFGEHAYKIPVSSIKSMIGHPLGAAGALQAITNCLVIRDSYIPPTINHHNPDPQCDLDYVPNKSRKKDVDAAMQNSCGFSGVNAVLVLKKYS